MSDIRIMERSVFTQFWYVEFNDGIKQITEMKTSHTICGETVNLTSKIV